MTQIRRVNRTSSLAAARERWRIFGNGREVSEFWPWPGKDNVDLTAFNWPTRWSYVGVSREIRYTSDKIMPDENPAGDIEYYQHAFTVPKGGDGHGIFETAPGLGVEIFVPEGQRVDGDTFPHEPTLLRDIERRVFYESGGVQPRFPSALTFLAKADGWTFAPIDQKPNCRLEKCYEVTVENCILGCSPEGDFLAVLDGDNGFRCRAIWIGETLAVGTDGIDDG